MTNIIILVVVVALVGGAAILLLKFCKTKTTSKDSNNLDDFDFDNEEDDGQSENTDIL